jgi:hypothetical protein
MRQGDGEGRGWLAVLSMRLWVQPFELTWP